MIRRITERQIQEGDDARIAAVIGGEQRHGVLEGVEVDFRHPDLPPDWEAAPWWFVWGNPPTNAGIIFPSEAKFSVQQLRDDKGLDASLPAIFARPGDRISVDQVIPEIVDPRFDHPHDVQHKLVVLKIERPDGEIVSPPGPLAFFGATQIRNGALRETFDHIVQRICSYAGVDDLCDDPQEALSGYTMFWNLPRIEDMAAVSARNALEDYFALLDDLANEGLSRAHLRRLANSAALAGFLLGKIEAQKPERIASGVIGNLPKAVIARTNWAWRESADAIWKENPDWRTNRVALKIAEDTDDDVRSISRAIRNRAPPSSPSHKRS